MDARRRQFLAAAGLGASSLFLPSLFEGKAYAQAAPPKRIVFIATGHGTVYENWNMRRSGLGEDRDWEFALDDPDPASMSEILRPLHTHRSELLVLDGLSLVSSIGDIGHNEHEKGQATALTGTKIALVQGSTALASGPSVDQLIAAGVRRTDRLSSLELQVYGGIGSSMVYSDARVRVPAAENVNEIFRRLFPGGGETTELTDRDRVQLAQQSVLEKVRARYDRLMPRMSGEDRRKLELHRDHVRDLELRIGALRTANCTSPTLPPRARDNDPRWYADQTDAMFRLISSALSCDLTRVVTLQLGQLPNEAFGAPPGDVHQAYAHQVTRDENARQWMTAYHRMHAEQVRDLITMLKSIPEGNGTLFDSTAIVWMNELATGNHKMEPWPVVLAGGLQGSFRTGRYLRWAPSVPTPDPEGWQSGPIVGTPHNKLWVSMCRAMGVDRNSVGLESLPARNTGGRVDLTGPLDRLS
jgi:hypothetical protein